MKKMFEFSGQNWEVTYEKIFEFSCKKDKVIWIFKQSVESEIQSAIFDTIGRIPESPKHTGAITNFLSRNSLEFDVWKMWIVWKNRLWKCEFW